MTELFVVRQIPFHSYGIAEDYRPRRAADPLRPDLTSFEVYGCSINSIDERVNEKYNYQ
jgi:hypothetical protein